MTDWYDGITEKHFDTAIHKAYEAGRKSAVSEPAHRITGWVAPKDHYAVPVLFNPYTGEPRDARDIASDPQGILIVPLGKVEMLAAKPAAAVSEPVAFDLQKALKRAFHLGQNYWADADSESYSANKRADKHQQDFDALCEEALAYTTPPAEAKPQWMPIATAPKDGSNVLVINDEGTVGVGCWVDEWVERQEFVRTAKDGDVYKTVREDIGYFDCGDCYCPTHWMPLPQPPNIGAKEQ